MARLETMESMNVFVGAGRGGGVTPINHKTSERHFRRCGHVQQRPKTIIVRIEFVQIQGVK